MIWLNYGWYQPCKDNLRNATCTVTNCSNAEYSKSYAVNVTYAYLPLRISNSLLATNPSPTDYCRDIRPINSTLNCYFDTRDLEHS